MSDLMSTNNSFESVYTAKDILESASKVAVEAWDKHLKSSDKREQDRLMLLLKRRRHVLVEQEEGSNFNLVEYHPKFTSMVFEGDGGAYLFVNSVVTEYEVTTKTDPKEVSADIKCWLGRLKIDHLKQKEDEENRALVHRERQALLTNFLQVGDVFKGFWKGSNPFLREAHKDDGSWFYQVVEVVSDTVVKVGRIGSDSSWDGNKCVRIPKPNSFYNETEGEAISRNVEVVNIMAKDGGNCNVVRMFFSDVNAGWLVRADEAGNWKVVCLKLGIGSALKH